jgi:hypothetical protein
LFFLECNEYKKIVTRQTEVISLALKPTIAQIKYSTCTNNVPLIVGGKINFFLNTYGIKRQYSAMVPQIENAFFWFECRKSRKNVTCARLFYPI